MMCWLLHCRYRQCTWHTAEIKLVLIAWQKNLFFKKEIYCVYLKHNHNVFICVYFEDLILNFKVCECVCFCIHICTCMQLPTGTGRRASDPWWLQWKWVINHHIWKLGTKLRYYGKAASLTTELSVQTPPYLFKEDQFPRYDLCSPEIRTQSMEIISM